MNNSIILHYEERRKYRLASTVACLVLAFISLYLMVTTFLHVVKSKRKYKISVRKASGDGKLAFLSKVICLLVTMFSFTRNVLVAYSFSVIIYFQPRLATENFTLAANAVQSHLNCDSFAKAREMVLFFGTGFVYLFLWMRQKILYSHPVFHSLSSKCLQFLSIAIVFLYIAYTIFSFTAFFSFMQFKFHRNLFTCDPSGKSSKVWLPRIAISTACTSFLIQLTLLTLFINPLLRQNAWRKKNNIESSALLHRVRKVVMLTSFVLISDLIATVVILLKVKIVLLAYNINLFLNNLLIIGCFDGWRFIYWPCSKDSTRQLSNVAQKTSVEEHNP